MHTFVCTKPEITKCKCFLLDLKMQNVKKASKRYVSVYKCITKLIFTHFLQ